MKLILIVALLFGQQENPRARFTSIYPHPPEPTHLVHYAFDVQIVMEKKHWLWTSKEPYHGKVQIQQARPRGGWWIAATRETDVNGRLQETIDVDSTWPQHVLLILLDGNTQVGSIETDLGKERVLKLELQ